MSFKGIIMFSINNSGTSFQMTQSAVNIFLENDSTEKLVYVTNDGTSFEFLDMPTQYPVTTVTQLVKKLGINTTLSNKQLVEFFKCQLGGGDSAEIEKSFGLGEFATRDLYEIQTYIESSHAHVL
jgi:hypothetical protein